MGFVRSHRQWGACAGLAALVLQIVLSFGHIHADDLGVSPHPADHRQNTSVVSLSLEEPANPDHHPATDDYCAICASIALIATALPSLPPSLIVPARLRYSWPLPALERGIDAEFALSFRARGPPFA
jgi:hypothetical protein